MIQVSSFLPSTAGLHFINSFPNAPLEVIDLKFVKLPLGNAANGLCGGMVFTVRDYYQAQRLPPMDINTPAPDSLLFKYLVQRLFDSFGLPEGLLLRYFTLMNPNLPDDESLRSRLKLAPHGRTWVMIKQEWPKIKADLDTGCLSPIGLIRVISSDPHQLGENHHVLAYGYDLTGDQLSIHLYDPNHPNRDDVTLSLSIADPMHSTPVVYSTGEPVYCFIRTDYKPSDEPLP